MDQLTRIRNLVIRDVETVREIRRHLHRNPELSTLEENTAGYIAGWLRQWGVPFTPGVAGHGIVATVKGEAGPGSVIALRADMDALPIAERNDVPYKSVNPGVMHACGHDAHMACLMGAVKILQELRSGLRGEFRCIFQPSEERFPGGAIAMIGEGVLEEPVPAAILGQHTLPTLEAGKIGMRAGKYMASTDELHLVVRGKGGHAATPEQLVDPVVITAHIITALQQIVSRNAQTSIPTLLSVGRVIADGRTNIIPDEVRIEGTFRTFDETWRSVAHERIREIATGIARGMGGSCEVAIEAGYPVLVNDEALTERAFEAACTYLGRDKVVRLDMRMTAEDFAYYAQWVPGCFYRLGTGNPEKGIGSNLHTATFDIDESSLETGVGIMVWLSLSESGNLVE